MASAAVDDTSSSPAPSDDKVKLSKTQESYLHKGEKSYYYWHPHIKSNLPIEPPQLISKTTVALPQETAYRKILNFAWYDDDDWVK